MRSTGLVLDVINQRGGPSPSTVTLYDRSRFANNGTFPGAGADPSWAQLPTGLWYLNFDGINDYIALGNPGSLNLTGQGTLEACVNFGAFAGAAFYGIILGRTQADYYHYIFIQTTDYPGPGGGAMMLGSIKDAGGYQQVEFGVPVPGTWYYMVMAWDGAFNRSYLNGAFVQQIAAGACLGSTDTNSIGGPTGNRWLKAGASLLRMRNYAMSAGEILNRWEYIRRLLGV